MEAPQFKDRKTERVYRRLSLLGPGPAAFFADAYRLMETETPFATRSHIVGHVLRELEGGVRGALATGPKLPAREEKCGTKDSAAKQVARILPRLGLEAEGPVGRGWTSLVEDLHGVAHRKGLRAPRPVDEELEIRWATAVDVFDLVLDAFEGRYAGVFKRLDVLLSIRQPEKEHLNEFTNSIPHTHEVLNYFFRRLESPAWFTGLRRRGALHEAPSIEEDPERNTFRMPPWPAAAYLKHIARHKPAEVAALLRELRSDNPRALEDAVEIILELPREQVVTLSGKVEEWVEVMVRLGFFGTAVVDLVERLAMDGEGAAAGRLLSTILKPRPVEHEGDPHLLPWSPFEKVPFPLQHAADRVFESLCGALGPTAIDLIGDLLDPRLRRGLASIDSGVEDPDGVRGIGQRDYSSAWFPNLRGVSRHDQDQAREFLVVRLRKVLGHLRALGTPVEEILATTGRRDFLLYRRIELDFLMDALPPEDPHVRRALCDVRLFDEPEVRTEYASLLRKAFHALPTEDKERVLARVRDGIQPEWVEDEDKRREWGEVWQRDWLHLVRDQLGAVDGKHLARLTQVHGKPRDLRTRDAPIAMAWEWKSPLTKEQVLGMSADELRAFISSLGDDKSPGGGGGEGLVRAFSEAVRSDPQRYSAAAPDFEGFPATYVEALLGALREARREGHSIEWGPVAAFGHWVVDQSGPIRDRNDNRPPEVDEGFDQARKHLMWLIGDGLRGSEDRAVPLEARKTVWRLIETVANDPDPTPEFESEWLGKGMGPHGIGLNTPRPAAISAALQYLFWVNRHLSTDVEPLGMDQLPEVRTLLEEHLDPTLDPSLGVRAIIGEELGRLIWFDQAWVEISNELLLPRRPEHRDLRSALFDAYLRYGAKSPTDVVVLSEEFGAAILRAGEERPGEKDESADKRLAEHLMVHYWRGTLSLTAEPGLLRHFFFSTPVEVRRLALHFVGWSLARAEEEVEQEALARLRDLWDWRVRMGRIDVGQQGDEMSSKEWMEFGWWFASRAFPPEWAIPQLQAALRERGVVEWDHGVAEHLAELVSDHPMQIIETLALFDPKPKDEPWRIHYWLDHAKVIFRATLRSDDPAVAAKANEVVNRWVAAGHLSLVELLESPQIES